MIIRIVRMTFRREEVENFRALFESNKSQIRDFPGCRHLELHQDANNPSIFCTYSHWDRQDDLDNYRKSELFGKVWPATKALFADKPMAFSNVVVDEIP